MKYNDISIQHLVDTARKAGEEILKVYEKDFKVERKEDQSPLTEADSLSNAIIIKELRRKYRTIPCLSEESKQIPFVERKDWQRFWLIDPLDGTKEFIKKNGEFTVNIALIENGEPVVGIVFAPVTNRMYVGVKGKGSFTLDDQNNYSRIEGNSHYSQNNKITIAGSRSHSSLEVNQFVEQLKKEGKEVQFITSGSSIKFCLVAEGLADVYPRFGPTMEWDTAAAQAVVTYAGKQVLDYTSRQPLTYNKEQLLNPWFIVE